MGNYNRKSEFKQKAVEILKYVRYWYQDEIDNSISKSMIYIDNEWTLYNRKEREHMEISVVSCDTISALFNFREGKTALLNFASYKNPGGKFLAGDIAQEECLCHASTLYPVLEHFEEEYYSRNRKYINRFLFHDTAIYSQEVVFFKDGYALAGDVITCAAPNFRSASKYFNVTEEENLKALERRIELVCKVAADNKVDTLILGAWGCGVFKQDPTVVARLFKKYLEEYPYFKKVVFAIPGGANLSAFQRVFT